MPRRPPSDVMLQRLRVALVRRAVLTVEGREEQVLAVDLGLRGVFVERTPALPAGIAVGLRFTLPGNAREIAAQGRVAWSQAAAEGARLPPGVGIEFTRLLDEDARRVRAFLLEHWSRAPRARQFTRDWPEDPA